MDSDRPRALVLGIALLALVSVVNVVSVFIPTDEEGPPAVIIWAGVVLGILGLGAAVALWQRPRWALWLAAVVLVLSILSAAPGIPFAPTMGWRIAALVGVIVGAVNLWLLFRQDSRAALTA